MNIRAINYILIAIFSGLSLSFQWPMRNFRVTSTFAENRWDHFHDGVDLVSPDNQVYPVKEGTLLYYWDKSIFPTDNTPGGGNYAVLKHDSDMYSIYMHLDNIYSNKTIYTESTVLGTAGNTGHSFARHLHFSLLNTGTSSSLNPAKLLPEIVDLQAPEISNPALKINDKYFIIRERADFRLTNHYPLMIKISDTVTGREKLGVYTLRAEFNGIELIDVTFKSIISGDNGFSVQNYKYEELMNEDGFYVLNGIRYLNGFNRLKVRAGDYNGNIYEKEFVFKVQLDME